MCPKACYDGWLVFVLAIATASSEDRPFLCRCAIKRMGEPGGLPWTQLNEIVCSMYLSTLPARKPSNSGFQNASDVVDEQEENGLYRLRHDLLGCVFALENFSIKR